LVHKLAPKQVKAIAESNVNNPKPLPDVATSYPVEIYKKAAIE
jgi:hypothetical protein